MIDIGVNFNHFCFVINFGPVVEMLLLLEITRQPNNLYLWLGQIYGAFLAYNKRRKKKKIGQNVLLLKFGPTHSLKYCLAITNQADMKPIKTWAIKIDINDWDEILTFVGE